MFGFNALSAEHVRQVEITNIMLADLQSAPTPRSSGLTFVSPNFSGIGMAASGSVVAAALGAALTTIGNVSNFVLTGRAVTRLPDPHELVHAYYRSPMAPEVLQDLLKAHNIHWDLPNLPADQRGIWANIVEQQQPIIDVGTALDWWNQGNLSDQRLQKVLLRHGYKHVEDHNLFKLQVTPFSVGFLFRQYHLGEVQNFPVVGELKRAGYGQQNRWDQLMEAPGSLDWTAASALFHRGFITQQVFEKHLRAAGMGGSAHVPNMVKASYWIPGPADLIRYAVKEVWDEGVVAELGYDNEFPARFAYWMKSQGADYRPRDVMPNYPFPDDLTFTQAEWRAHWYPISPTQAYQMQIRLRPGRVGRYIDQGFNLLDKDGKEKPFTVQDTRRWLRIADYPEGIRDYLAALSYSPLRLVDIRRNLELNQRLRLDPTLAERLGPQLAQKIAEYDRAWAIEQFRDRGLHPDDAAAVADATLANSADEAARPLASLRRNITGQATKDALEQYRLGIVDQVQALARLKAIGLPGPVAESYLALEDSKRQKERVKRFLAFMRREFYLGKFSPEEAKTALRNAGIRAPLAEEHVEWWLYDYSLKRKMFNTEQIQKYLLLGFISLDDAVSRLSNIGWQSPEIIVLVAEAQRKLALNQQRALAAAERNRAQQAKELERVIKEGKQAVKTAQSQLRTLTPVNTVLKWLRKGVVNEQYVRQRLFSSGYSPADIELYLAGSRNGTPAAPPPGGTEGTPEPPEAPAAP
jgi:hypothetical protein